jgi:hypothetical protein
MKKFEIAVALNMMLFSEVASAGQGVTAESDSPVELSELVVISPHIEGSLSLLTDERRNASGVTDALGSEQMARSGDGNAAAALKRVSGLSVMGGKYIYVRGLGERYSSTLFNGAVLPSPEPSRRVVPLDMFPTGILGSVVVRKTYAPNLSSEFGGGVVEMATRTVPEKPAFNLAANIGYSSGTTFAQGQTYKGGGVDWLGFDDGERELPKQIRDAERVTVQTPSNSGGFSPARLEKAGEALPNVYSPNETTLPPDYGFSVMGGRRFALFGAPIGLMSSMMYGNGWENESFFEVDMADPERTGRLEPTKRYDTALTQNKVRTAGIAVVEVGAGDDSKVELISSYLHNARKSVAVASGFDMAEGDDAERRKTRLGWIENSLWTGQLRGSHQLGGEDFPLKWNYTFAQASAFDRARRSYTQEWQNGDWVLRGLPRRIDASLVDKSHNILMDTTLPLYVDDNSKLGLGVGASYLSREREAELRRFKWVGGSGQTWTDAPEKIFTRKNIGPENSQFHIEEDTVNTDRYVASQDVLGVFGSIVYEVGKWTTSVGLRRESFAQSIETMEFHSAEGEKVNTSRKSDSLSPLVSVGLEAWEGVPVRLIYSRTLARPDFKELSPAPFWDDRNDSMTRGYPKLRETIIDNFDFRVERYLSATENYSVGAFFKRFKDPVEVFQTGSLDRAVSFRNAKGASNAGLEVDGRKELGNVLSFLQGFTLSGNYTLIQSRVELGDGKGRSSGYQTSAKRSLQGQSPYVANVALEYEPAKTGLSLTAMYNVSGARITEVGVLGEPDVYEQPAHLVDLVIAQKLLSSTSVKLQLKNLLGADTEYRQGDRLVGREEGDFSLSLGLSGTF